MKKSPASDRRRFLALGAGAADAIVANAAIVPAGTSGAVSSFVTNETALILDTNGYFAP